MSAHTGDVGHPETAPQLNEGSSGLERAPQPYWQSPCGRVVLYHGDCLDVLPTLPADSAGLVCTDPPYAAETHKGARTRKGAAKHRLPGLGGTVEGTGSALVDFAPMSVEDVSDRFAAVARVCCRWLVATMDWSHVPTLHTSPPAGLRFIRFGVWTKTNGAPQFTGDRPGTGWEAIAILHRDGGKMAWNGGGKPATFHHGVERFSIYPTQKPLSLIREFVTLFSDPGDLVLDPFCGSGTTLVAALERGRRAIGIDISAEALGIARSRCEAVLGQANLFGGTGT